MYSSPVVRKACQRKRELDDAQVLKKEDAMEKPEETITSFDRVDQAANPTFFTQFMDKSHTLQSANIYR